MDGEQRAQVDAAVAHEARHQAVELRLVRLEERQLLIIRAGMATMATVAGAFARVLLPKLEELLALLFRS